jgi:hypothetical protein
MNSRNSTAPPGSGLATHWLSIGVLGRPGLPSRPRMVGRWRRHRSSPRRSPAASSTDGGFDPRGAPRLYRCEHHVFVILTNLLGSPVSAQMKTHLEDARSQAAPQIDVTLVPVRPQTPQVDRSPGTPTAKRIGLLGSAGPNRILPLTHQLPPS